jgi:hypothetical protein
MNKISFSATLLAFSLLMGLFLAPSSAWSMRPQCDFPPPTPPASGVCFLEGRQPGVFFEAPLAAPEEMVLVLFEDTMDDFVRIFPGGQLFAHTPEREGDMIWCPFPFAEFDFDDPQPECVFGTARLQANGYIELSGDFSCPYTSHLSGTGLNGTDGVAFAVSADLLLVPSNQDPSGCEIVKDDITASPIQ